ncbi:carboxypeptidase-like regulatory domain-containing protein [Ornithinibacillus xuwenensis]|uniref:Carboxypeptidase-like regulatory domain-containing protein n=1 Tax=Ornithinibacillus xuwenensis TaxID=3144668 RepID=A0ABU9XJJ0_9BACI
MKIKVKVKHLIMTLVGIFLLVPLFTYMIIPRVEIYLAEKKLNAEKVEDKEEILELIDSTPLDTKKWELIRDYMIGDGLTTQFDVYIGPSFTQWGQEPQENYFTWEEKLPYIQAYAKEGPVDGYLVTTALLLASYYEREGELENAKNVLYDASSRFIPTQSYNKEELLLERIRIAKNHGELEEADQYIESLLDDMEKDNYQLRAALAQLKVEIILQQGDFQEAYTKVSQAISEYEEGFSNEQENWEEDEEGNSNHQEIIDYNMAYSQLLTLERYLNEAKENHGGNVVTVTGKVTRSDGTPVENVGVFLRDESNVNHSVMEDEPYQVLTDEEGKFEFRGVLPSSYQLFLGFYYDQIDGWTWPNDLNEWIDVTGKKDIHYDVTLHELIEIESPVNQKEIAEDVVHFKWEEVEDASYYNLSLGYEIEGGSVTSVFKTKITDNQLDVPIEEIYNHSSGIMFDQNNTVDPNSILAYTNPENRLFWNVSAYNDSGELMTQSNGYRLDDNTIGNLPFFYLKERELTKADRLLLEGKTEEALELYQTNYTTNPEDVHSLRMVVRLIGLNGDGSTEKRSELALPYMEDFALKSTSAESVFDVVQYYYELQKWEDFNEWFARYVDRNGELNDYVHSIYASALMKQGKFKDADEQFKEAMKKDPSHRFVGNWIANELYWNGISDKTREIAKENPERSYGENNPDWSSMVSQLIAESTEFSMYQQELNQVLEMYFNGEQAELAKWHQSTEMDAMSRLLEAIENVN